jgi:hypothetical protein
MLPSPGFYPLTVQPVVSCYTANCSFNYRGNITRNVLSRAAFKKLKRIITPFRKFCKALAESGFNPVVALCPNFAVLIPLPPVTRSSDVAIYLLVRRLDMAAFWWQIMLIRKS